METRRTLHDVIVERESPYSQGIKSDLKEESFLFSPVVQKLCCVDNRSPDHATHKES